MSIMVQLENERFWDAANKARAAQPLSNRSVTILEACQYATRENPAYDIPFGWAYHLREKGLLDYRGFDPKLKKTRGGHFITEAGKQALRYHYSTPRAIALAEKSDV